MARVSIVKRIKDSGRWVMRSIPRKQSGGWDWNALPDGRYYVEWYEEGVRKREPAGTTAAEALEVQRKRRHNVEARGLGLAPSLPLPGSADTPNRPLRPLVERYLDQIETLKKPNTHRKYEAVLLRFADHFRGRTFESVMIEELNDLVVETEEGRHGSQHGPSQRNHHRPVLQTQRPRRDHAATSIAGAHDDPASGISGREPREVLRCV